MNIFIVPIEPIDQRYTKQWYDNIPKLLRDVIADQGSDTKVITIDGKQTSSGTTAGAFLDFAATNIYKANQVEAISFLFQNGGVRSGDRFLVTDAWNFNITAIRYMSELLDIPVEIHCIWHAGSYDPSDILGMKMNKDWSIPQELAWFKASDFSYFATQFHADMFKKRFSLYDTDKRIIVSGQPHEYLIPELVFVNSTTRDPIILFPHRLNSDKQPEIARDLAKHMWEKNFLFTQDLKLSKNYYYDLLGRSQAVFSCALHENLGISVMEGVLAGAIPIVPDRCSYSEMYLSVFKYPSEWTSSVENYSMFKLLLKQFIEHRINNRDAYLPYLEEQKTILIKKYMNADKMIYNLVR